MPYRDVHAAAFAEGGELNPESLLAEYDADESTWNAKIAQMGVDSDAALAAVSEQLAATQAENVAVKAANYDLLTAVGVADAPADDDGGDSDDPDENATFDTLYDNDDE